MRWEATSQADPVGCEVGELYRALSEPLERVIRSDVHASASVIEDACQFAWARLVHHRDSVRRETAFGWLVKTALHEAFKLIRRAGREVSLEKEIEAGHDRPDHRPGPPDLCERRERLGMLSSLSARQQRLLWLYGVGLTYAEIAARDGSTPRTVERQLLRARLALRAVDRGENEPGAANPE
jgi:RNA polymerase sigma factor (sigma-70 family)